MGRSTEVAAPEALRKIRADAAETPGGDTELLPDKGTFCASGSPQWKHSDDHQSRPRIPKPQIPPAEGQAHGGDKHRIHRDHRYQESSVKSHPFTNSRSEPFCVVPQKQIRWFRSYVWVS